MNLKLAEIAAATGGRLVGPGTVEARGYSIDTRTLKPGDLFFAIAGPRFDGHDFLAEAARRDAAAAVVSRPGGPEGLPTIVVGSTTDALGSLARAVRRRWGRRVIGITGSTGKTTTKEMIAAVLGERWRVLRSVGNMNNAYGLPLSLLRAEPYHDVAVLEMGMSAAGEIAALAAIAEPGEGVVTNVNPVHLEFFDSIEGIARAKAELLEGLVGERRAYLNNDDSRVRAMARRFDGDIVTWGVRSVASFRVTRVEHLGLDGTALTVHHGRRDVNFVLPLLGTHNVSNAAAAIAVGCTHGLDWDTLRLAIEKLKPGRMRGNPVRFHEGFALIDDSYNSNPRALTEMIRLLVKVPGFDRRIVVAGEMLELGETSSKLHAACGRDAVKAGVDMIGGVRGAAGAIRAGARRAGADDGMLRFFPDAVAAGEFLVDTVRKGDLVLVKGSRGVRLEQVVDTLRLAFRSLEP